MMGNKEALYFECMKMVDGKVAGLKKLMDELRESAANETKSTAGDKHETALAMLQIEQANTAKQLEEARKLKLQLSGIDISIQSNKIITGSLVTTSHGCLFLSTALGKIKMDETVYIALSPQSPLGAKLLGLQVKDVAEMNGRQYHIEAIE